VVIYRGLISGVISKPYYFPPGDWPIQFSYRINLTLVSSIIYTAFQNHILKSIGGNEPATNQSRKIMLEKFCIQDHTEYLKIDPYAIPKSSEKSDYRHIGGGSMIFEDV
jgi:hypothetical protein